MTRWLVLMVTTVTACSGGDRGAARVATRDSTVDYRGTKAAVRIVDNPAEPPADAVWRLSEAPELDLVGDPAKESPLFRVAGAVRLSDGTIVVADGGSTRLRVFDRAGTETHQIGKSGAGPGEFQGISYFGKLRGDSLVVADFRLGRVTVFDARGTLARQSSWGKTPESPRSSVIGVFGNGALLGRGFVPVETPPPHGQRRYAMTFYHLAADGTVADTLGDFAGNETYFVPIERGFRVEPARFAKTTSFVAAGDRFYVAPNESYEVLVFSQSGTPLTRIRKDHELRAVQTTDLDRDREVRMNDRRDDNARKELDVLLKEMPAPPTMPAFDRIAVDDAQNVWVRDYVPPGDTTAAAWLVFDREGALRARLQAPRGFEPTHIGDDFMLGIWKDENGVEHVQLYTITK